MWMSLGQVLGWDSPFEHPQRAVGAARQPGAQPQAGFDGAVRQVQYQQRQTPLQTIALSYAGAEPGPQPGEEEHSLQPESGLMAPAQLQAFEQW